MSYEKIVSDMHEREGKPELANIRAELELQVGFVDQMTVYP